MVVVIDLAAVAVFCSYSIATAHLGKIKKQLGPFAEWKNLGLYLGISPDLLEVIEKKPSVNQQLHDVLYNWLIQNYNKVDEDDLPSWDRLADAVDVINPALASTIRKN